MMKIIEDEWLICEQDLLCNEIFMVDENVHGWWSKFIVRFIVWGMVNNERWKMKDEWWMIK